MKLSISDIEGFIYSEWFSKSTTGIYYRDSKFVLNFSIENKNFHAGTFETKKEARIKRRRYYLKLFLKNLNKNNIRPKDVAECNGFNYYFATKCGKILNKFGNVVHGGINRDGYNQVIIKGKNKLSHRIILETFMSLGKDNKLHVNHINGIKTDNRLENLEWTTRSENTRHAFKNGLQNNIAGRPVVTKEQKNNFIELRNLGYTYKKISEITGYSERTIRSHSKNEKGYSYE